jgi:inner membrane protein
MKRMLFLKGLIIAGLALLLLIPLAMVEGQITARNQRQIETEGEIAELTAGRQQLTGPLLVVDYEEATVHEEVNEATKAVTRKVVWVEGHQVVAPKTLTLRGVAKVEERRRGLFKAQAYELDARLVGTFAVPANLGLEGTRKLRLGRATLVVGLSDLRGIRSQPALTWAGRTLGFAPGVPHGVLKQGIQVDLGPVPEPGQGELPFDLPLALRGSGAFSMAPVAESTKVTLTSPWPTPSFQGRFLAEHAEGPQGFTASWEVFHLARNLHTILEGKGQTDESFGVAFQKGLNVYLMTERAAKYGFLFVGLTFAAFFFFEMLRRLPIHPIQYLLVGFALAIFFLLLLSLSERMAFGLAYGLAASACTLLLGSYLAQVLRSFRRGWGFAASLGLLFGVLYVLISSEDNALLMGSLLTFLGLAAVMIGTRRIDWYALSESGTNESGV